MKYVSCTPLAQVLKYKTWNCDWQAIKSDRPTARSGEGEKGLHCVSGDGMGLSSSLPYCAGMGNEGRPEINIKTRNADLIWWKRKWSRSVCMLLGYVITE